MITDKEIQLAFAIAHLRLVPQGVKIEFQDVLEKMVDVLESRTDDEEEQLALYSKENLLRYIEIYNKFDVMSILED